MFLLPTLVLAGSALTVTALAGQTVRRRKAACRTWLAASQRNRDRGMRTPRSLLFDGLQKTFAPLGDPTQRPLRARRAGAEATRALERIAYRECGLALLTLGCAAVGMVLYAPLLLLTVPMIVYLWREAFTGAYRALWKAHRVSVDVLYVCTTILAITSGYFLVLAFVAALYCGSRVLLLSTQSEVQANAARMVGLTPEHVWLVQTEVEVALPLAQVAVGDVVVVHAGDAIPVDGYVTAGTAYVEQQRLTGEAPLVKTVGDYVWATSVLRTGKLYIRVDKISRATPTGSRVHLLCPTVDGRASVGSRGHVVAERFALPVLLLGGLALLTGGPTSAMAVLNATIFMSLLTVGPLCLLTGLQRTAQHQMVVQDGRALEQLAYVDTVVLDTTGIWSRAQPAVSLVDPYGASDADAMRADTAASEAQGVMAQLRRHGMTTCCLIAEEPETPTQRLAQVLGVDRYFANTQPQAKASIIAQLQAQGHVVCYVGDGVNDARACRQAQVAVSLRDASTAVTDSAHVVVLDEQFGRLGDLFAIAADGNKTLTTSLVLALVPGGINIIGAFFWHFGFLYSVLCSQAGLWASIGNALWPLFQTSGAHNDGLTQSQHPTAGCRESQSVKTTEAGGEGGDDKG
jgi:cation transport ATPase